MNKDRARDVGERVYAIVGNLPRETKLDDLFNYHMNAGNSAGNPPRKWLAAMDKLNSKEKRTLIGVIGMVNRVLYKSMGVDITLGDLKSVDIDSLVGMGSRRWSITEDGIDLLRVTFRLK